MEDIKTYMLSIFATALLITVVDILAPTSTGSGLSKHLKLVTSLVFICILISPTVSLAQRLDEIADGNWELDIEGEMEDHYAEELQNALDDASRQYFEGMLKETLCQEFEIAEDNLRVHVEWQNENNDWHPKKVTVILSGKGIWKNPAKIEEYVSSLLDCDCVSAIE
ncbi:MAG: stage III sporulation protein AF [Clostridia bacterium]|nr:stage III sporulation protein AF [Clostridia bacterium]